MSAKSKYPEYKTLNLPEIDQQILKFWKENKIFEKSISSREGKKPFVFYEGPPSANGRPGIHHVISRTIKDLFCRYKTLQGFQVKRKGGWDTHGLPVELSVEKMLGIRKDDIGKKISIEEYNRICRQEVMKYKNIWDDLTEKMGYWVDLEHPYITFENSYIETLWWLLKQFYERGYLYEGFTVQPYSPAAGTGLSTHELNQPGTYKILKDVSIVAMFKAIRNEKSDRLFRNADTDIYFVAWTTTPWTLPSNCALAVGENIAYNLVRTFNPYTSKPVTIVLAKDLVHKYFPEKNAELKLEDYKEGDREIPFKVIDELKGKDLEWIDYEQLLPYAKPNGLSFVVITGDFVTTEEGTGIVHTASLFGADDFRVCKAKGIASVLVKDENGNETPLVDKQGRFTKEVTDFAGEYVKEQYLNEEEKEAERKKQGGKKYLSVDERIGIKLKTEGKAFKIEKFEHSYPHCWRTDKPVLYYPLDAWFIKTTAKRDRLVELNKTINWKPESTGTGRFGNWLENIQDWNLSRSRFWGTPLPIWKTEDGSEEKCIGSLHELTEEFQKALNAGFNKDSRFTLSAVEGHDSRLDIDLHRPYVDEIVLISDSGKPMRRVEDLIDVWFDSGSMPYAQWGLDEKEIEEKDLFPFSKGFDGAFPADFIAEGVDQTRGWFYTLHVIAGMLFDSVAYKNVAANGLVLDKFGNKMSKRIGNVVEPFEVITKYGADATRWYLMSNSQPWDNLKFDISGVDDARRKLFGTLYNTYSFFALYANIDGFTKREQEIPLGERSELDRWIISKLNTLIRTVTDSFEDYNPTPAARAIEEFVDRHLSNWYVRLSRRRFWRGEMTDDKQAAYETLLECLNTVAQLMASISPFFPEWLYRNLNADSEVESIHYTKWKNSNAAFIDLDLEERMELAQVISSLVLSIRKRMSIKVRQPLQKVVVPFHQEKMKRQVEQMKQIILSEVNVKELELLKDDGRLVKKRIKPNYKLLGEKLGKNMKAVAEFLANLPNEKINELEDLQHIDFSLNGSNFSIQKNEVEIITEDVAGWQVASGGNVTVALDIQVTEALKDEGTARELVNRIQNLRKEMDLNVTDRIDVKLLKDESLVSSVNKYNEYIRAEILADSFQMVDSLEDGKSIEVNELPLKIIIKPK